MQRDRRTLTEWVQTRMTDQALLLAAHRFTLHHFGGDRVRAAAFFQEWARDDR